MGITVHYCGKMDRLEDIERMENRVTDLAFALGGRATIWRSFADHDLNRVVRGLKVTMAPGQETLSLLVSPEGYLVPIHEIEAAEKGEFNLPPYCFVKTQFGSVQAHVAVVLLLDALKQQFCSDLTITDEGGYYEDRDVNKLAKNLHQLGQAINMMADGLREYGLSPEASEDPQILITRIERIAALVHKKIHQDGASGPECDALSSNDDWHEATLEEEVAAMEAIRRKNILRGERMDRRINESIARGMSPSDAMKIALREEGLGLPPESSNECGEGESWDEDELDEIVDHDWIDDHAEESTNNRSANQRPSVTLAQQFFRQFDELSGGKPGPGNLFEVGCQGALNIVGGLVQATGQPLDDRLHRALAISQLHRALEGHAFARGAVFALHSRNAIDKDQSLKLHDQLKNLLSGIHELMSAAWDEAGTY